MIRYQSDTRILKSSDTQKKLGDYVVSMPTSPEHLILHNYLTLESAEV